MKQKKFNLEKLDLTKKENNQIKKVSIREKKTINHYTYFYSKNTVLDLWSVVGPYSCLYTTEKNFLCISWGGTFFINCN